MLKEFEECLNEKEFLQLFDKFDEKSFIKFFCDAFETDRRSIRQILFRASDLWPKRLEYGLEKKIENNPLFLASSFILLNNEGDFSYFTESGTHSFENINIYLRHELLALACKKDLIGAIDFLLPITDATLPANQEIGSPIYHAIENNNMDLVVKLLSQGFILNDNQEILQAVKKRSYNILEMLIFNESDDEHKKLLAGNEAIFEAIAQFDLKMVRLILEYAPSAAILPAVSSSTTEIKYPLQTVIANYEKYKITDPLKAKENAKISLVLLSYGANPVVGAEKTASHIPSDLLIELLKEDPTLITNALATSSIIYDNALGKKIFPIICEKIHEEGMFDIFLNLAKNGAKFDDSCATLLRSAHGTIPNKKFIIPILIACGAKLELSDYFGVPQGEILLRLLAFAIRKDDSLYKNELLDFICREENSEILNDRFKGFKWNFDLTKITETDAINKSALTILNHMREDQLANPTTAPQVGSSRSAAIIGAAGIRT